MEQLNELSRETRLNLTWATSDWSSQSWRQTDFTQKAQTKGVEDTREGESPTHLEWSHQQQISFDFLHSWTLTRVICIN